MWPSLYFHSSIFLKANYFHFKFILPYFLIHSALGVIVKAMKVILLFFLRGFLVFSLYLDLYSVFELSQFLNIVWSLNWMFSFLLNIDIHFFRNHFLKWIAFSHLLKSVSYLCVGLFSGLFILFYWYVYLSWCQYHIILMTVVFNKQWNYC